MPKAVAVVAIKGGVGKTTCSINIARRLADHFGQKVGLIDADFDNSNFSQFTNIEEDLKVIDAKEFQMYDWRGIQVFSMSLIAGREQSVCMTGDRYGQMLYDVVNTGDWDVDYFIIDMPAGSSDVFRYAIQVFAKTLIGNVIITQPSMIDAFNRVLNLHKDFGIPIVGIIENMAYIECPECQTEIKPFGEGQTIEVASKFDAPVLGKIPLSPDIALKQQTGEALFDDKYYKTIDIVCEKIIEAPIIKTGIIQRLKEILEEGTQTAIKKVLVYLIGNVNTDFDIPSLRRRTGLVERKIFTLVIVNDTMHISTAELKSIAEVNLRLSDKGLRVVKNVDKPDFEVVTDFRTFSRIIMRKRKNHNGGYDDYSGKKAWLSGDLRVYGTSYTAKTVTAIREIFDNEKLMGKVGKKYNKILERFI